MHGPAARGGARRSAAWAVVPPAPAASRPLERRAGAPPAPPRPPTPSTQNASITNNLLYHPPREGPALFRGHVGGFQAWLPGPGIAYTAVAKWYTESSWPQVACGALVLLGWGAPRRERAPADAAPALPL